MNHALFREVFHDRTPSRLDQFDELPRAQHAMAFNPVMEELLVTRDEDGGRLSGEDLQEVGILSLRARSRHVLHLNDHTGRREPPRG